MEFTISKLASIKIQSSEFKRESTSFQKSKKAFGEGGEKFLDLRLPKGEELFNKYSGRLFAKEIFLSC